MHWTLLSYTTIVTWLLVLFMLFSTESITLCLPMLSLISSELMKLMIISWCATSYLVFTRLPYFILVELWFFVFTGKWQFYAYILLFSSAQRCFCSIIKGHCIVKLYCTVRTISVFIACFGVNQFVFRSISQMYIRIRLLYIPVH